MIVYRSLNKPLTIFGVERRLFFLALAMSGATFNFFGSLRAALLMGACLYAGARWATAKDPEMLRILFRSSQYRARYDPGRFEPVKSGRIVP